MPSFNIVDFGAVGDGVTNNAAAIQRTIDECHAKGGGRVIVPTGGVFVTGPFKLKSYVDLNIEASATLRASLVESLYTETPFNNWSEGSMWISAKSANHIAITGTGTIDGRGTEFMENEEPTHYNYKFVNGIDRRPHLLTLIGCNNVTIREVTFANAAYWCVHPAGCQDVLIQSIRILNSLKVRNCDGIDIDHCRNVRISNCYIESADDSICIKNRRDYAEYGLCENITITGCILTSTSCALKLGSENMDTMRNIIVEGCVIKASNRGVGIQNRDEGTIENVLFSNIIVESRLFADVWWGKAEPIYITAFKRAPGTLYRFADGKTEGTVGKVRNIRFNNILCRSENGVYIGGCADSRIEEVLLENVRVEINKTTDYCSGMYDRRPCDVEGIIQEKTAGFFIHDADDIILRNCRVVWGPNRPAYYGRAIESQRVTGLELENFKGSAAHPEESSS
ncbi:MAG: glycoside hydrolase family 28 protein [Chloroflexi bacterium]|nr:glycoside hydrolase family 28 protein [Chloroflexota bacterium]